MASAEVDVARDVARSRRLLTPRLVCPVAGKANTRLNRPRERATARAIRFTGEHSPSSATRAQVAGPLLAIHMVEYLKAENQVLRERLPKRISVTTAERRRLVKLGKPLGRAIKDLVTAVTPRTFLRWVNGESRPKQPKALPWPPGRPKTADEVRELILLIAG